MIYFTTGVDHAITTAEELETDIFSIKIILYSKAGKACSHVLCYERTQSTDSS